MRYAEIYRAAQNTGDDFKKVKVLSLKEISSFAGDFVLIWTKQRLIWFNLQRDGTRNGLSNIKETFCRKFAAKNVSFLHQSISIFKGWSLKFIWWLGKVKVKKKYPMCQIPIKMLKQHATPNSCLHNSKNYSSKGHRKTSQRYNIIYVIIYNIIYNNI